MAYQIVVDYNGRIEDATLEAVEASERIMGVDVTWEVTLDDETVVMRISEYPEGGFTEVDRDPALTTSMEDIVVVITRDREPKESPEE